MLTAHVISLGAPSPMGATPLDSGVNFAVYSSSAEFIEVCLFSDDGKTEQARIRLPGRTGDVHHGFIPTLKVGQLYGLRAHGAYAPKKGLRFNPNKLLIDPYAKALSDDFQLDDSLFGYEPGHPDKDLSFDTRDSAGFMPKCVVTEPLSKLVSERPNTPLADTVFYEAHVKGLTQLHLDVPKKLRGTFAGLTHPVMIAHYQRIGVTAIELLPVQSFFSEPRLTRMGLTNYWGYNPINFFAPHRPYGSAEDFRAMAKTLHAVGLEVILDVVYNHTAESWALGPTLSYRGLDNAAYYHLRRDRSKYVNHTGTGNSLNLTHPAMLQLAIESLRYWVEVMGVDGFRFDLAVTPARNPHDFDPNGAFMSAIAADPVLSNVKLIAEPWDIGPNGYQVGNFPNGWSEWNDRFRDDVRRYWKGEGFAHKDLAARLLGSADIYDHSGREPQASINKITSHDGFTLTDLVSFNHKHNKANGEGGRDGHGHNISDNMGHEGPTDDAGINAARTRRKQNFLATLMLSQGVPLLLAGDEIGHSQQGNNNAYCQDDEITWLNWAEADETLTETVAQLTWYRTFYRCLRQRRFLHGELGADGKPNVSWLSEHGPAESHDWDTEGQTVTGLALSRENDIPLLVYFCRGSGAEINLPEGNWRLDFSTADDARVSEGKLTASGAFVALLSGDVTPLNAEQTQEHKRRVAEAAGVLPHYHDIHGGYHKTSAETAGAILLAMSGQFASPPPKPRPTPKPIHETQRLEDTGKVWGVTCALYGLRSSRNWGIGDFEDLAQLAEHLASQGADFVGLNPVHALFPAAPHLFAPYSPSSREFLNVMHIAPDKIPELPGYKVLKDNATAKLRDSELVDYPGVYALKTEAFETAFGAFEKLPKNHPRKTAFTDFCAAHGDALTHHAVFDALIERLPKTKQTHNGGLNFAKKYAHPDSTAVRKFASENAQRVRYYQYLQFLADEQLKAAQARAKAAGMRIGLYLDFAVGVVPGGSDAWRRGDVFAKGISLGAPGDLAAPQGQRWNLLPFNPHALMQSDFAAYRAALAATMRHAGAVRVDHVLGLKRSFWIPEAAPGAYVKYPFERMVSEIGDVADEHDCLVFGEDLGTVPEGFRDEMAALALPGCGIAMIDRDYHGHLLPAQDQRRLSLTAFSNHDFPTLAGWWAGKDFTWRSEGAESDEQIAAAKERRAHDRAHLADMAGLVGVPDELSASDAAKIQSWLASGPALAIAVQLDDLLLDKRQPNVPGTVDEQPNWRMKMRLTLEDFFEDADAASIMTEMARQRPR